MLVSVHGFFAFAETDDSTRSAYPASRSDFSLHMTIFGRPDTISYVTMDISPQGPLMKGFSVV